ncbi:MAG: DUF3276 family protein [Flavobacteriales bacterium]
MESKKYLSKEGPLKYKKYQLTLCEEQFSKFRKTFDEMFRFIIEQKKTKPLQCFLHIKAITRKSQKPLLSKMV